MAVRAPGELTRSRSTRRADPRRIADYLRSHDALVGDIAERGIRRWRRRHNYYLNCLRDVDRNIGTVLDELDALGLASSTIVVLTADHGDMDGAHRLHAKGATAYREQNQRAADRRASGLSGRQALPRGDVAPRHRADAGRLTGASAEKKASITKGLPGKDFSGLLAAPEKSDLDALRDGALYCYNMFAYIDGDFMTKAVDQLAQPDGKERLQAAVKDGSLKVDLAQARRDPRSSSTAAISSRATSRRSSTTGPTSLEALLQLNDVELFDHAARPARA